MPQMWVICQLHSVRLGAGGEAWRGGPLARMVRKGLSRETRLKQSLDNTEKQHHRDRSGWKCLGSVCHPFRVCVLKWVWGSPSLDTSHCPLSSDVWEGPQIWIALQNAIERITETMVLDSLSSLTRQPSWLARCCLRIPYGFPKWL